jgi:hypothetical protein
VQMRFVAAVVRAALRGFLEEAAKCCRTNWEGGDAESKR